MESDGKFFGNVSEVIVWLEGRRSADVGATKGVDPQASAFCSVFRNHFRCGEPVGHSGPCVFRRDDSFHFGKERRMPVKAHFDFCNHWSLKATEGMCMLAYGHAGDHIYKLLDSALPLAERCNVWSQELHVRCDRRVGHDEGHNFPRNDHGDISIYLKSTKRTCTMSTHCAGTMVGCYQKFKEARLPVLWWHCTTCGKRMSFGEGRAKRDTRVINAIRQAEHEKSIEQAALMGAGDAPVDTSEVIETTAGDATGDLGEMVRNLNEGLTGE